MDLSKIRMLSNNPRYTRIKEIDLRNLLDDYNEIEVMRKLLSYEEEFNDFLDLLNSFDEKGFIAIGANKLLVLWQNNKMYILEGNRRFLAIKVANKDENVIKLLNHILENTQDSKIKNNIRDILKLNIKPIEINDSFFEDLTDYDDETIWSLINSKHAGEERGKRKWSRAKYFYDLKDFYFQYDKKISEKEIYEKAAKFFDKPIKQIKADYKNAVWVTNSIDFFNANNIDEILVNNSKVSNIELILNQKFIDEKDNQSKSLKQITGYSVSVSTWDFSFSELTINQREKLILLLLDKAKKGEITTRKIEDTEIISEIANTLNKSLFGTQSIKNWLDEIKDNAIEKQKYKESYDLLLKISHNLSISREIEADSLFVKSIKYLLRNDLKVLQKMDIYWNKEYPFSSLALVIRNIIHLILLELEYRFSFNKSLVLKKKLEYWNFKKEITSNLSGNIEEFKKNGDINIYRKILLDRFFYIDPIVDSYKESLSNDNFPNFKKKVIDATSIVGNYGNSIEFKNLYLHLNELKNILNENDNKDILLLNNFIHKSYMIINNEKKVDKLLLANLDDIFTTVIKILKELTIIVEK